MLVALEAGVLGFGEGETDRFVPLAQGAESPSHVRESLVVKKWEGLGG